MQGRRQHPTDARVPRTDTECTLTLQLNPKGSPGSSEDYTVQLACIGESVDVLQPSRPPAPSPSDQSMPETGSTMETRTLIGIAVGSVAAGAVGELCIINHVQCVRWFPHARV